MSIKSQIIARILAILQPLLTAGIGLPGRTDVIKLRVIARKNTVGFTEPVKPALHFVSGDEVPLEEDERGYTCNFPVAFKLIISEQRDAELVGDELCAFIQKAMEADEQLGTLASKVTYNGNRPSLTDQGKPDGEIIVDYMVEYRRYRGDPGRSY